MISKPKICTICNRGKKFKFIIDHKNKYGDFSLFECSLCKTQFWNPFKNPGNKWYEDANEYLLKDTLKPIIYKVYHKKFLKLYKKFSKGTKFLDIGCGTGELLAKVRERGADIWGVDFDNHAINIAKKYFNLKNVFTISIDDFFAKNDLPKFDIITFFEVIEHLEDPSKFIKNVKKLLKPDGFIILSTPNRERMLTNLSGWDFPPHHLLRWNKESIANLFKNIDFKIVNIYFIGEFNTLSSAINEKFRANVIGKTINNAPKNISKNKMEKIMRLLKFFATLKQYIIGGIPALFLYSYSKLIGRTNGDMLIKLKKQ